MGVEIALGSFKCFTSNAGAGSQDVLPLPVLIDVVFSDARRPARRVAASRRRTGPPRKSGNRRVISSSSESAPLSNTFGATPLEQQTSNRGVDHSCICRANSFDGLPERESDEGCCGKESLDRRPPRGIKNQPDARGDEQEELLCSKRRAMVSFKFGSAHLEGFRRSSSLDFEDEFFTRMIALEASQPSRASDLRGDVRACTTLFDAAPDSPRPTLGHGVEASQSSEPLCALGMGGVQLPSSIKKLRRRTGENNRSSVQQEHPRGCAIKNAFSSMVYMIKVVQSHALQIRQVLFSEWDMQEVLHLVHREMHSSFVWLFQQVFACTPKLMVSVMLLLANFTVYSMGENVAIASVTETPAPIAVFLSKYENPQASLDPHFKNLSSPHPDTATALGSGGRNNNNNNSNNSPSIAESFDGDTWLHGEEPNMFSQKDSMRDVPNNPMLPHGEGKMQLEELRSRRELMKAWVESSMKQLKLKSGENHGQNAQLEQETIRRLVAPVVAHLESDNYVCFDRTDLEYQHALSKDPSNSLLLANYAQFLYVVRHDHDRAEGYFHRAMQKDPLDSAILGRFASFLWLGRRNRSAAERAYKAAMAADPESSFPASNYAHFLWHVGDGGECDDQSAPSSGGKL